jgi:hypothetical protein
VCAITNDLGRYSDIEGTLDMEDPLGIGDIIGVESEDTIQVDGDS